MINIPGTDKKWVVIVGCGFTGLTLDKKLRNKGYRVVILDNHNYHSLRVLLLIFMNWAWRYFIYDQSTRFILRLKGCAELSTHNYSIPE
jgi:monoamine oxidase